MELYQLRYFCTIAAENNYTRAAEKLHVSQSSLTKAIQRLEGDLGVCLFKRNNRQIELTQAGRYFYESICRILQEIDLITEETKQISAEIQGTVNINIPPNIGANLLQLLMKDYIPNNTNMNVRVIDTGCMAAWDMILEDKIDLGWAMGLYIPKDIEFHEVEIQEFFLATSAAHPITRFHKAPTFLDLKDEIFLIMNTAPDLATTKMLEECCHKAGYHPISGLKNLSIEPHPQIIREWVRQGLGITFLPEPMTHAAEGLSIHSMDPPLMCPVGIAWNKKRSRSTAAKALCDYIISRYPKK